MATRRPPVERAPAAYSSVSAPADPTALLSGRPPGDPPRRSNSGGGRGGGGKKPKQPSGRWKTIRRVLYGLVALGIIIPMVAFLIAYAGVKVPKPGDLQAKQVATIFASNGTSVLGTVVPPNGNRAEVTIDQIPKPVRDAVVAAEDRSFYSNPGFSVTGFARALRDNLTGAASAGGGSTITQQYVKNAMLTSERKLSRKVKELVISAKMARTWSKDEILAAYLNTIYFGRGAYGIAAAAKAYFDQPVEKLGPAQGAVLAALIREPSDLDPEQNPTAAKARWDYVLDGMVSMGTLSASDRANLTFPRVIPRAKAQSALDNGPDGLIKNQVIRELSAAGISEQQINSEGLQITTTIDMKAQQAAVNAVNKVLAGQPAFLRTAVVSVDPHTGDVRAYYGGKDGTGYDFANAGLQTGSTFKVYGLAANLQLGHPLSEMFDSSPVTVNGIKITNVEGEACGVCTIAEALKRSLNTSFYRMELQMPNGPEQIADMAHRLGIPDRIPGVGKTLTEPDGSGPNNGVVLGQYQVRALDMASAYATIADSGTYHAPHFVQKVVSVDGQVLLDRTNPAGEDRVSPAVADNVTAAMEPIAHWSFKHDLADGRPSATKTGTAQLGDTDENKDAWMIGFTPSLSTAVWMGSDKGVKLRNASGMEIYGAGLPADIWKKTMDGALAGTPVEQFPKPAPIGGQAGVPPWSTPYTPPKTTEIAPDVLQTTTNYITPFPGVTIPVPGVVAAPAPPKQVTPQGPGPMPGQPTAGDPSLAGAGNGGDGNSSVTVTPDVPDQPVPNN